MQDSHDSQNGGDWRSVFLTAFLIWLTPTLVGVTAKAWFLAKHGFASVAASLSLHSLSLGQRLSFFRADLAFGIFLVPLCFLVVRALLPIRWYSRTVGAVAVMALLVLLVAFGEFVVLGNLAGYGLLLEGFNWGIAHPSAALEYLVEAVERGTLRWRFPGRSPPHLSEAGKCIQSWMARPLLGRRKGL